MRGDRRAGVASICSRGLPCRFFGFCVPRGFALGAAAEAGGVLREGLRVRDFDFGLVIDANPR